MSPLLVAAIPESPIAQVLHKRGKAPRRPSPKTHRSPPQLRFDGLPAELSVPEKARSATGLWLALFLPAYQAQRRSPWNAETGTRTRPADISSGEVRRIPPSPPPRSHRDYFSCLAIERRSNSR